MIAIGRKWWLIAAIVAFLALFSTTTAVLAVSAARAACAYTVVIDAGHGGLDGGVTGVNTGVRESDLNLKIAKLLEDYLRAAEIDVVMTRTGEGGLYPPMSRDYKSQDMKKRGEIANSANADLLVSVHCNRYVSSSRRGAQVFFNKRDEGSRSLAHTLQDGLNAYINQPLCNRGYAALCGDYYMVQCAPIPSVIVECGFLSNPEDERLLLTEEHRDKLAYRIFSGIMTYLLEVG